MLKVSENFLKAEVANTWVNRLIRDELEPKDCELSGLDLWFSDILIKGERMGGNDENTQGRGMKDLPTGYFIISPILLRDGLHSLSGDIMIAQLLCRLPVFWVRLGS